MGVDELGCWLITLPMFIWWVELTSQKTNFYFGSNVELKESFS